MKHLLGAVLFATSACQSEPNSQFQYAVDEINACIRSGRDCGFTGSLRSNELMDVRREAREKCIGNLRLQERRQDRYFRFVCQLNELSVIYEARLSSYGFASEGEYSVIYYTQ